METEIRLFRSMKPQLAVDEANIFAENHSMEIVSASMLVVGEGRASQEALLTVVLKKIRKRAPAKSGERENNG